MALAVVHDLREARTPAGPDELAAFETDALAGLVLARAAAGLADSTIAGEVIHLEQVRAWLGRPLWTMQPADADAYFGQVLRSAAKGAHLLRAWLENRRTRWPGTANPHLLINAQTALGTGPVSRTWVNATLRGHAATIEALRVDRQLEEAMATGADPLHLAATFGLDPGTAVRYASSARQLLQTPAEQQDLAGFPANPRTGSAQEGRRPLSSRQGPFSPAELRGKKGSWCGRGVDTTAITRSPPSRR